jgi:hypothetical protein
MEDGQKIAIEFSESEWMRIAIAVCVMAESVDSPPLGANRAILDRIYAELDLAMLAEEEAPP